MEIKHAISGNHTSRILASGNHINILYLNSITKKTNIEHRKTHTAARACQYAAATAPRTVHLTQVRGWFLGGTCNSVQEQCATLDFLIYSVSARATILSEPQTTRTNPLNT